MDLIFGDPEGLPHMVRFIGKAIERGEILARRLPVNASIQGALFATIIVAGSFTIVYAGLHLLEKLCRPAWWLASVFLIYQSLSIRCLWHEVKKTGQALRSKGLHAARRQIARIVGRDTERLDETGISRAAIETVAENMVDGVLSPFFYAVLGGPALAVAFKAISTLDSMIGYKNDAYIRFGTFGARLDDAANYIPARIAMFLIPVSALLLFRVNPLLVLFNTLIERKKHASPNSGIPEAAFAFTLGVSLSGPSWYHGKLYQREFMNTEAKAPVEPDIKRAINLFLFTSFLFILMTFACCMFCLPVVLKINNFVHE